MPLRQTHLQFGHQASPVVVVSLVGSFQRRERQLADDHRIEDNPSGQDVERDSLLDGGMCNTWLILAIQAPDVDLRPVAFVVHKQLGCRVLGWAAMRGQETAGRPQVA